VVWEADRVDLSEQSGVRRSLFSTDVTSYQVGRPGYPERVYELLGGCGLEPGARVLEIGPGTGQATGRLLDAGASVTAVELGAELAVELQQRCEGRDLTVVVGPFEQVAVEPGAFDLVVAATSFHWVPTAIGLDRCADALRSGGGLALWWNVFGDPDRPDPFGDALSEALASIAPQLLDPPGSGRAGVGASPYALDAPGRLGELAKNGRFGDLRHEVIRWTARHSTTQLRSLFASLSPWLALSPEEREPALDAVAHLAEARFGGVVERPYLTSVYLATRLA
jgi:SAM-dependent methyltransferase